jgi:hypothetical protein
MLAGTLLIALTAPSCGSLPKNEVWSFPCTREFCRAIENGECFNYAPSDACDSEMDASPCLLLFVFLPVAFDLAVLPVTAVHDTLFIQD